jgi:hypothetical protein
MGMIFLHEDYVSELSKTSLFKDGSDIEKDFEIL